MARRKTGEKGRNTWRSGRSPSEQTTIGLYQAKAKLSELVNRAERGEEFTVTKNGRVAARIVPPKTETTEAERRTAIEKIFELRKSVSLGGLKIRDLIAEGRR